MFQKTVKTVSLVDAHQGLGCSVPQVPPGGGVMPLAELPLPAAAGCSQSFWNPKPPSWDWAALSATRGGRGKEGRLVTLYGVVGVAGTSSF